MPTDRKTLTPADSSVLVKPGPHFDNYHLFQLQLQLQRKSGWEKKLEKDGLAGDQISPKWEEEKLCRWKDSSQENKKEKILKSVSNYFHRNWWPNRLKHLKSPRLYLLFPSPLPVPRWSKNMLEYKLNIWLFKTQQGLSVDHVRCTRPSSVFLESWEFFVGWPGYQVPRRDKGRRFYANQTVCTQAKTQAGEGSEEISDTIQD